MDEKRLIPVNIDVSSAAEVVLGSARAIASFRPAMVQWFGEAMASEVERLELLASPDGGGARGSGCAVAQSAKIGTR